LLVVVGLAWAPTAGAASAVEELSKRLPDNVIGLMATSGGDALKDDFGKTAIGRIWNDQGVQSFYRSIKTELVGKLKLKTGDPNIPQRVDEVLRYARVALSRPLVLGISEVPVKEGPPACVFAIVNAGPRKAELTAALSKLEAMAGDGEIVDMEVGPLKMRGPKDQEDMPLYWGWVEDYLVVVGNDAQGAAIKYVASPRPAASAALSKVPVGNDALVDFCDYPKLGSLINSLMSEEGGMEEAAALAAAAKSLGLTNLRTLVARVSFAGPDLVADALLEMPVPATGVFAAYKPVDPSWLAAVDSRAVAATAINVDIAGLYDLLLNTIKTVSPDDAYPEVQNGISAFESQAKVQIRGGLLNSLAGPAVFYVLPAGKVTEAPRGGFVLAAKLKDAQQFEKAMTALGDFAGAQSGGVLQVGSQTRDDGRVVHIWVIAPLAMMSIMPTWSVANDHVVVGSNKELCELGVKQLTSKDPNTKSLLDTEGYKKAAAGLPANLVALSYTDSRVQLEQTMTQIQQVWPMATMAAMQAGVKLPVMLPSLTEVSKDLGPSCGYRYFSPEGLRFHYRGAGIEATQMTVAGAAVGAGIAMPAMAKAREQAKRAASMSNLKQIGLGVIMYADQHDNKLPDDLKATDAYRDNPQVLDSPRKPKDFTGPSYIYIAAQSTSMDAHNIIAYENPAYCSDGVDVLFLDGHVEFMKPDAFRQELAATYKRLGKEVPEIKFKDEVQVKPAAPKPVEPSQV
jgi:prepilin-type processing-associated H-X9-DG protein